MHRQLRPRTKRVRERTGLACRCSDLLSILRTRASHLIRHVLVTPAGVWELGPPLADDARASRTTAAPPGFQNSATACSASSIPQGPR